MKITKVSVNRKFHLPEYESIDVSAEAELSDTDNLLDIWTLLKDNAENWFSSQQRKPKPVESTPPQPKPTVQPQQPQQGNILNNFSAEYRPHITTRDGCIYMAEFISRERWEQINEQAKALGYKWIKNVSDPKASRWEKQ